MEIVPSLSWENLKVYSNTPGSEFCFLRACILKRESEDFFTLGTMRKTTQSLKIFTQNEMSGLISRRRKSVKVSWGGGVKSSMQGTLAGRRKPTRAVPW